MISRIKKNSIIYITILFLSILPIVYGADTLSKYEQQLEDVKQEQLENFQKLTGVEKELALYAYDVAQIDSEVVSYSKDLAGIEEQIADVEDRLEQLETDLEDANENYSIVNSTYANRLRSIYENGIPSIFELIITSNGFTDLMVKLNIYSMILEHDKTLMNTYQDRQNYINYIKGDIELDKKQLEALRQGLEDVKADLEEKRVEKVDKMSELEKKQGELQNAAELLTQKRKQAIADIDNEMAKVIDEVAEQIKNGTSATFTGTDFAYPTPGFTIITTRFGEVYNLVDPAGSAHTGADIAGAGINCTPIYAIQSGTVTTSGYSNYGYGNYIIINHGECTNDNSSYISLYGHCSSLAVEEGQVVEKGQLIGYVGTTGNSTGPHLHLEVRVNGTRVDPLQFFPSVSFTYY